MKIDSFEFVKFGKKGAEEPIKNAEELSEHEHKKLKSHILLNEISTDDSIEKSFKVASIPSQDESILVPDELQAAKKRTELELERDFPGNKYLNDKCKLGPNKFVPFPNNNAPLKALLNQAQNRTWFAKGIDVSRDRVGFEKLPEQDQRPIKYALTVFARFDGIVNENITSRFMRELYIPEATLFWSHQGFMESQHALTYAKLIRALISNDAECEKIFADINHFESVCKKELWTKKWMEDQSIPLPERLLAFVCVEGIFFCASFCLIFWFKQFHPGICEGLIQSNRYIFEDEALHARFSMELLSYIKTKYLPSTERIHQIFKEAVECEGLFAKEAIPSPLPGMNAESMLQYVKYSADYLLAYMGQPKIYNVENPFSFMENMSLMKRGNFFEVKNTDYNFFPPVGPDVSKSLNGDDITKVDDVHHLEHKFVPEQFVKKRKFVEQVIESGQQL